MLVCFECGSYMVSDDHYDNEGRPEYLCPECGCTRVVKDGYVVDDGYIVEDDYTGKEGD